MEQQWVTTGACEDEGFVNCTFKQQGPCLTARHGAIEAVAGAERERRAREALEQEYAERYFTPASDTDPYDFSWDNYGERGDE